MGEVDLALAEETWIGAVGRDTDGRCWRRQIQLTRKRRIVSSGSIFCWLFFVDANFVQTEVIRCRQTAGFGGFLWLKRYS